MPTLSVRAGGRLLRNADALNDEFHRHGAVEVQPLTHRAGGRQDVISGEVEQVSHAPAAYGSDLSCIV
jgi:hypothetical protein